MNKRLLAGVLTAAVTVPQMTGFVSADAKNYNLTVNNTKLEATAFEDNGTIMIPVRAVCEALGMEVLWNGEAERVEITKLPIYITFSPDEDGYTFAKTAPMKLGKAPQLINDGTTYVPSEFFGEILPASCETDENGITITAGEQENNSEIAEKTDVRKVVVTEIGEKKITVYDPYLGETVVQFTDETAVSDKSGAAADKDAIKEGMLLEAEYAPFMTLSLPPITNAVSIVIADGQYELMETTVQGNDENGILVGSSDKITEQTVLIKSDDFFALDADGNKVTDFKEGDKITAIVSMASTRSLPPQRGVCFIRVNK